MPGLRKLMMMGED
jgi:hypothetical protein